MKTAVVHDWLYIYAGAERVLESILRCSQPEVIFTLVDFLPEEERFFLQNIPVRHSFLQNMPFIKSKRRLYLPLMPLAIESLDVSFYDLVISSSFSVAKGILTHADQLHICYCSSLTQYAWDLTFHYMQKVDLDKGFKNTFAKMIFHYIRLWDVVSSNRVDHFVSISKYIANSIWRRYRRESEVIYPPVDIDIFQPHDNKDNYYITASRFVPYKNIDLIIETFSQTNKTLIVAGAGPELKKLKAKANNNIHFIGYKTKHELKEYFQKAKAFIYAAVGEAFGIVLAEAQASGTPVIAFGHGGALEIVNGVFPGMKPGKGTTGVFFRDLTVNSLMEALEWFEHHQDKIDPTVCRTNAERFSRERFEMKFKKFVQEKWTEFESLRSIGNNLNKGLI